MINAPENGTPHFLFDIAKGKVRNQSALNLFGFNRVVGTTFETIGNYGGIYPQPESAAALSCASSSASDTMAVLISGLDADHKILTETVTLDGTTPVSTSGSFLRVNSAVILAGSNVGNITISNDGDVLGYIEAGIGLTQTCHYTVPANHALYLFRIDLTSGTVTGNKYLTYRNTTKTATGRTLKVAEATCQSGEQSFDRQVPFRIDEKTDFSFEAKSSSNDNEVSIFIEAVLVRLS